MNQSTITIPPGRAANFRQEAETTLRYADVELQSALRKHEEGHDVRGMSTGDYVAETREKVSKAEALLARLDEQEGRKPLTLRADEAVASTLHGLLLNVSQGVYDKCERVNVSASVTEVRASMADLCTWLDLLASCPDPSAERVRLEQIKRETAKAAVR